MTWGAPIWIYLWLVGMAGGVYFAAFLADRFSGGGNRQLLRLAVYLGIPLAIIGMLLLIIDLGNPLRFWQLFTQFKVVSPMSFGVWILTGWVVFAAILAVLWNRKSITGVVSWIGLLLSMALMIYTGVLLAVSSQPMWESTALLPSLFVASAISTGVALLVIASLIVNARSWEGSYWRISNKMIRRLAKAGAIVILVESAVLVGYAIWLGTSAAPGAGEALRLLTTGDLAVLFWVGVVLLALLLPLGLDLFNWGKKTTTGATRFALVTSSVCVLLGGLILRAVIVIGGQT